MGPGSRAPHRRLWARAILAVGLALAVSLVGASPASAHATLIGADPAPGATLPQAPGADVLQFSEAVDYSPSAPPQGSRTTSGRFAGPSAWPARAATT